MKQNHLKKTAFLLFCLIYFISGFSQNYWVYHTGSIKEDEVLDICKDQSGNIISVGYFAGQTQFSPGNVINPSALGVADIFIQKSNSNGQVLWTRKAGGIGSDKALSVKCDNTGNIYVTGFYYGSANFGSTTLTSINGSQDCFISKIDGNGNFIWTQSINGSLAEWGNSVSVDNLGNVIVTGQFQGSCNFGTTTLTSIINPNTSFSSFDVFTAKYNSSGNLIWARQGSAKYDDKGLDVLADSQNNIYVCGQFSDTINFQNQHNNNIMNAIFIIKYDASGQEVWFRRAAGVFSIAYDMVLDNNEDIYITGDFQGTLTYFGSTGNNFINGLYNNKAYILKISKNADFIWGKADASSNYLSSKKIALDSNFDPYIFGEFGCTHNEYSDQFGPGVFNSIGFQDFFITKYNNTGTRQWMRHFGGPRNDKAYGLLLDNIGEPIMAGSFENQLNIPSTNASLNSVNFNFFPFVSLLNQPANYCTSPNNYNNYYRIPSNGYSDAFIFKGIDLSRKPYDYYDRAGTLCNLDFAKSCIEYSQLNCPDTIKICVGDYINANTHASTFDSNNYGIGPIHQYNWNNTISDSLSSLFVNTSGYRNVKVKTLDGCYTSYDTVYVKINPLPPPPVISDSYSVNVLQPPATQSIHACGPATITLTGGNVQTAISYQWTGGSFVSNHDSVALINQSGQYNFNVIDHNNCVNSNTISIQIDNPLIYFKPKSLTDSLDLCKNSSGQIIVYDSITNPNGLYPYSCITYNTFQINSLTPGLNFSSAGNCDLSLFSVSASNTGWYNYSVKYGVTNFCGTFTINLIDSIYINIKPSPSAIIAVSGNTLICPGDSTLLSASVSGFNSPNVTYTLSPTTIVTGSTGYNYFSAILEDTISGCFGSTNNYIYVQVKPNPFIILNPYNAIICPNDSVKLTINLPGANTYEWHGPQGLIPSNSQTIYQTTSGFYFCIVTDANGCVFTTNTIELKQYATPYLVASPNNIICNNNPINLHVVTLDSTLIQWMAPLTGGGATKVITLPGTYSCNVTMCGITTPLAINILGSAPISSISVLGASTICPFDSVKLQGNPGMANYIWQPGNHLGQNYTVYNPGTYSLQVTDIYGCSKTSAPVTITFTTNVASPNIIANDTVCSGNSAVLSASVTSGNQIDWYNSSGNMLIGSGNIFTTAPVFNTTIFMQQQFHHQDVTVLGFR